MPKRACKAFAEIPKAIWDGVHDHIKAYPGDNGIRYVKKAQ